MALDNTYRSGEKFETAQIDKNNHIFSYNDEVRGDHKETVTPREYEAKTTEAVPGNPLGLCSPLLFDPNLLSR